MIERLGIWMGNWLVGQRRGPAWLNVAFLTGLWLAGLFLFGQFLNWGRIPFDWHDWAEISAPRVAFVRDAVLKGALPLHMPDSSALRGVTDRFLALPDVITSPQMILLRWLEVGPWLLVNTWLLYSLGVLGLLWLRRRYGLSPLAFTALFLLFNFNGGILAHLSVGHANFAGYFLFPWLVGLVLRLLENQPSGRPTGWRWVAAVAFLLAFILFNGAFHQFVWGLMLLGLVGVFNPKTILPVLKALVAACLLGLVRLLPPALEMARFDNQFLGGYPSLGSLAEALLALRPPAEALAGRSILTTLGWWEFDLYAGLLGAAFLLVFGLGAWLARDDDPQRGLLLPGLTLLVLSIGPLYRAIMLIPIPLLNGERVSARLITLPFVLLTVLAARRFQVWLDRRERPAVLNGALAGLALLLGLDLYQNLKLWRVNVAAEAFPVTPVDLALKVVANHPDAPYTNLLIAGAVVTLLTAVALAVLAWREKDSRPAV